jgi:hypothetical protein
MDTDHMIGAGLGVHPLSVRHSSTRTSLLRYQTLDRVTGWLKIPFLIDH